MSDVHILSQVELDSAHFSSSFFFISSSLVNLFKPRVQNTRKEPHTNKWKAMLTWRKTSTKRNRQDGYICMCSVYKEPLVFSNCQLPFWFDSRECCQCRYTIGVVVRSTFTPHISLSCVHLWNEYKQKTFVLNVRVLQSMYLYTVHTNIHRGDASDSSIWFSRHLPVEMMMFAFALCILYNGMDYSIFL